MATKTMAENKRLFREARALLEETKVQLHKEATNMPSLKGVKVIKNGNKKKTSSAKHRDQHAG